MNKVVLITGSSRGIGKATAELFAKNGYNVVINSNNSVNEGKKVSEELKEKYNIDSIFIQADVSSEEQVKEMINKVINRYGKIDVLVNNAGIVFDKEFKDRTLEDFKKTFGVNTFGVFLVSKYVSEYMLKNKKGKIINVSSTNGIDTIYPTSIDYDASKAAVISLTKDMALEFAPYINVNGVAPGWTDTEMNKDIPKEDMDEEIKEICLGRLADPSEIATVIYFLASAEANYITGEIIRVDGGML